MTREEKFAQAENTNPEQKWVYRAGSAAALLLLVLLLVGITGIGPWQNGTANFQNNWLMVLYKINIRCPGASPGLLNVLNLLDIVIMVLFGVLFLVLDRVLHRVHRVWSAIAACLPFLGMVLFLITHTAGRSGLLVGSLIFSAVMLGSRTFSKSSAAVGIIGSTLLFFGGDIGTTIFPPSVFIAALIGTGYILWIIWFFLIGRKLFQLGVEKTASR